MIVSSVLRKRFAIRQPAFSPLDSAEVGLEEIVDGVRYDLANGDSPEQVASMVDALFRRDPGRGAMLLAAALLRLARNADGETRADVLSSAAPSSDTP